MLAYQPVRSLATLNMGIQAGLSAARRILPVIDQKIEIKLLSGPLNEAKICADGQDDISAEYQTVVNIQKMHKTLKLVHPKNNDFFEACREKLGWSLDITKNNSIS